MSEYRIVFNRQTDRFRIEQRGLFGWNFLMDDAGEQYLTFESLDEARRCLCRLQRRASRSRRWQVVHDCTEAAPAP